MFFNLLKEVKKAYARGGVWGVFEGVEPIFYKERNAMKRTEFWTVQEKADYIENRGWYTYTDLLTLEAGLLKRRRKPGPWTRQERTVLRVYV